MIRYHPVSLQEWHICSQHPKTCPWQEGKKCYKVFQGFAYIPSMCGDICPLGIRKKCHVSSLTVACMQLLSKGNFSFPIKVWPHLNRHPHANHGPFAFQNLRLYPVFFDIIICRQHYCPTSWNFKDWCFQRNALLDCKHSDGAIKPTVHTNTQCERIISMVYTATNPVLSLPLQSIWAPMWLSCGGVGKFFRNV